MQQLIQTKSSVYQKSYAKINLYLDVEKQREDSFHDICTVFSEVDIFDDLIFSLTKKECIKFLSNTDKIRLENNLVYQVAFFIKEKYDVRKGCKIILKKRIPISAGLGGGSSNAAATITALNKLWDLNISDSIQYEIASQFGSDISFFLKGGTAIGKGKGNELSEIADLTIENIVLVNPGFPIASSEAYSMLTHPSFNQNKWDDFISAPTPPKAYNKLEEKVIIKYPEVQKIIKKMKEFGAENAILSGSGATVIGFCSNNQIAQKICEYYSTKKYWNCITKTKRRTL
jgi:4-diphosphocytidyl-2C-methyl-D-erythritol kinase